MSKKNYIYKKKTVGALMIVLAVIFANGFVYAQNIQQDTALSRSTGQPLYLGFPQSVSPEVQLLANTSFEDAHRYRPLYSVSDKALRRQKALRGAGIGLFLTGALGITAIATPLLFISYDDEYYIGSVTSYGVSSVSVLAGMIMWIVGDYRVRRVEFYRYNHGGGVQENEVTNNAAGDTQAEERAKAEVKTKKAKAPKKVTQKKAKKNVETNSIKDNESIKSSAW